MNVKGRTILSFGYATPSERNMTDDTDGYQKLAEAIILKAVDDYRHALRKRRNGSHGWLIERTISDCERFFLGDWFKFLTDLDGRQLMNRLKGETK